MAAVRQRERFANVIRLVSGRPFPVRNFEASIGLTYQWVVRDGWYIQPDLQYIIQPAAISQTGDPREHDPGTWGLEGRSARP